MKTFATIIGLFMLIIVLGFGLAMLLAWPTMWLWNYVMPFAFPHAGIAELDFWHAFALNFLCSILFKSSSSSSSSK